MGVSSRVCFLDVYLVLNDIGVYTDSFKYLFLINAQKKTFIQYIC